MEEKTEIWAEVLSQYFSENNWKLEPVPGGHNNLTKYIITLEGTFVIRIYQNGYGVEKIKYELELLKKLQSIPFSFQIPRAYPTLKGEECVITPDGTQAVVFYLIPGREPHEDNIIHVKELGRVAGELLYGLSTLKIETPCPTAPYYDLYKRHPFVPNKETLFEAMARPIFDEVREQADFILKEVVAIEEDLREYCNVLPKQIIHGDLFVVNCLIQDNRMTAILDFEFASIDWKVLEIAICVARFPALDNPWSYFDAFLEGFRNACVFAEDEIKAIPQLMKLRLLANTVHNVGRYLGGFDPETVLTSRMDVYCKRIKWINENSSKLVEVFKNSLCYDKLGRHS